MAKGKGGKLPEQAKHAAMFRTIPDSVLSVSVSGTAGTVDLNAVTATDGPDVANPQSLLGKYIYLFAIGLDVTIIRKASGVTAGVGFPILAGQAPQEMFVDRSADIKTLVHRSTGAATLLIMWDSEL